jgi:hypothetical protein
MSNKIVRPTDSKPAEVVVLPQDYTEAQVAKVAAIKQAGGKAEVVKCLDCGKTLVRDVCVEREEGDLCAHYREKYGEGMKDHFATVKASLSASEVPLNWIKVAVLHKICERNDIAVTRMVNAMGKDRGLSEPLHPKFKPLYVGNARWLDPWCASKEGLDFLRAMGDNKSTVKAVAKKTPAEVKDLAAQMNAMFTKADAKA